MRSYWPKPPAITSHPVAPKLTSAPEPQPLTLRVERLAAKVTAPATPRGAVSRCGVSWCGVPGRVLRPGVIHYHLQCFSFL